MNNQKINTLKISKVCHHFILLTAMYVSLSGLTHAQNDLDFLYPSRHNIGWLKYSDAPNAFYHHLSKEVFDLSDARNEHVSSFKTLADWQQRQNYVNETLQRLIGPFPDKTPLNPKIKRTIKKDDYRIEHIIYESRPGMFVTSSLYIPESGDGSKKAAIIYCSGHSTIGYRGRGAQNLILNLVKKGFIVFAFDPLGQGERIEYYHPETGQPYFPGLGGRNWITHQHSYPGAQTFITGSSQINYMAWDGIRAIDYLLTRAEVDPLRIGITGGSGGGTQSSVIAALDNRIYACAPERYITSMKRLFESIGPQDAEQIIPWSLRNGLDHADLLTVRAPKPTLVITTTNDFFSIQGARETFQEASAIYNLYGKPDNLIMVEDSGGHTSTKANREAMYAFFQNHLDTPGSTVDQQVNIPADEELKVTTTGQVISAHNSETVFSLNMQSAMELNKKLEYSRQNSPEKYLRSVITQAKVLSGYIEPDGTGVPVYAGKIVRNGYQIERYIIEGEGNYPIPYLLMVPEKPNNRAILYLHPDGKSVEASEAGEIEWFVKNGFTVLAPDLIGTGETSGGLFLGDSFIDGVSYNMWFSTLLTGKSFVGIRAGDVSKLVQILENKTSYSEIYALARQEMSPVLLHAAAFNPSISRIALISPLSSYHSILTTRIYKPSLIHGAVANSHMAYDLQDLAASLAPRKLLMINMTDAAGNELSQATIESETAFVRKSYLDKNVDQKLIIESGGDIFKHLTDWIGENE